MRTVARLVRLRAVRAVVGLAILLVPPSTRAATLDGVTLPNELSRDGHVLRLNGIALRTYSIFDVSIYVAGLYLEQPTRQAADVLGSHDMKVLLFHFVHDVSADSVRQSWAEGFDDNCPKPCGVSPRLMKAFLDGSVAVRAGDESALVFGGSSGSHVSILLNNRQLGAFDDAGMANLLLASFLGPHPPSDRLKRELLGAR